jgi:hypothetical protein
MLEETLPEYSFLCFVLEVSPLSSISLLRTVPYRILRTIPYRILRTVPYWIMSSTVQLLGDFRRPLKA